MTNAQWPVGRSSLCTWVPCKMSKLLAFLRGWLIARERSMAVRLAATPANIAVSGG